MEYCGDEKLLESLEMLKTMISDKKFPEKVKQDMFETFDAYIKGDWELDKDMIKYLFTGFMMHKIHGNSV